MREFSPALPQKSLKPLSSSDFKKQLLCSFLKIVKEEHFPKS
jgi:hypothetical protein